MFFIKCYSLFSIFIVRNNKPFDCLQIINKPLKCCAKFSIIPIQDIKLFFKLCNTVIEYYFILNKWIISVGVIIDIKYDAPPTCTLLIMFFIFSTTFVKIAGNRIEIPSGSDSESEAEQKQISITLSAESIGYGEGTKDLSMDQLRLALAKEKFETKEPDARMVVLETNGEVLYERYFQVVMAINDAGGVLTLIDHAGDKDEEQ